MTSLEITEFVSEKGSAISKADLVTLDRMLFELPLEDISDVRAWTMESVALIVNDPLYEGDIPPIE